MKPRIRVIVPVRPGDRRTGKIISLFFWLAMLALAIAVLIAWSNA